MLSFSSLRRRGFTVLEVLVALLVIGVLTSVAVVKFADAKQKLYIDAQMNDLRNYALAQELYYDAQGGYGLAADVEARQRHHWSADVAVDSQDVATPTQRWFLRTQHAKTEVKCWLAINHLEDPNAQRIRCGDGIEAPVGVLVADFWAHPTDASDAQPIPTPDQFTINHSKIVQFNASSSIAGGSPIVQWLWAFGDGQTATGQVVTHDYAAVDTFDVELTVVDADGQRASVTKPLVVENLPPVAILSVTPSTEASADASAEQIAAGRLARAPLASARASSDGTCAAGAPGGAAAQLVPGTYYLDATASCDPDGRIVSHDLFFSDWRSATGPAVIAQIAENDSVDVILTVVDDMGAAGSSVIPIRTGEDSTVIDADFTWQPGAVLPGATVTFDATATTVTPEQSLLYIWDYGDWRSTTGGSGEQPQKVFSSAGVYSVQLTVLALSGKSDTVTKTVTVSGLVRQNLVHEWSPCASYQDGAHAPELLDVVSGRHLLLGSSLDSTGNDPVWVGSPTVKNRLVSPPMLYQASGGVAQFLTVPASAANTATAHTFALTIAPWMAQSAGYLFRSTGPNGTFTVYVDGGAIVYAQAPGSGLTNTGLKFPKDGALHTVTYVADPVARRATVYLDGVAGTTGAAYTVTQGFFTTTSGPAFVGAYSATQYKTFGLFGDMLYHDRALTAAEVQQNHNALVGTVCAGGVEPASVTITPDPLRIGVGQSEPMEAAVADSAGQTLPGRAVLWRSLNPDVATVDANGIVTGAMVGEAAVVAIAESRTPGLGASDTARVIVSSASRMPQEGLTAKWSSCIKTGTGIGDREGGPSLLLGATADAAADDPIWTKTVLTASGRRVARPGLSTTAPGAQIFTVPASAATHVTSQTVVVVLSSMQTQAPAGAVFRSVAPNGGAFMIRVDNAGSVLVTDPSSGSFTNTGLKFPKDGLLHTLAFVANADSSRIMAYLDGQPGTAARPYTAHQPFWGPGSTIGSSVATYYEFLGTYTDIATYDRALSADEVRRAADDLLVSRCDELLPQTLSVTPDTLLVPPGGVGYLIAEGVSGTDTIVNPVVEWSSANPNVATVDSTGMVTALRVGQTFVHASADWVIDSALVIVQEEALVADVGSFWSTCGATSDTLQVVHDRSGGSSLVLGTSAAPGSDDPVWVSDLRAPGAVAPRRALSTRGTGAQFMTVPADARIESPAFTLMLSIASWQAQGPAGAVFRSPAGQSSQFQLRIDNAGSLLAYGPGVVANTGLKLPNDSLMHTIAWVADPVAQQVRVYLDGVLGPTPMAYGPTVQDGLWMNGGTIGSNVATYYEFIGDYGDILTYSRTLSATEVQANHARLIAEQCPGTITTRVRVTPDPVVAVIGTTAQVTADVLDGANAPLLDQAVSWRVADTTIATIDPVSGTLHARKVGTTVVSARALAAGVSAEGHARVQVTVPQPVEVRIDPSPLHVMVGTNEWLKATLYDAAGRPLNPADRYGFAWSIVSGSAVRLDYATAGAQEVRVYGPQMETALVRVRYGALEDTVTVIVSDQPQGSRRSLTMYLGTETVVSLPAGTTTYSNSAPDVVRVSFDATRSGNWIAARAVGTAQIVFPGRSKHDTLDVTVIPRTPSTACATISPDTVAVNEAFVIDPTCSIAQNGGFSRVHMAVLGMLNTGSLTAADIDTRLAAAAQALPPTSTFGPVTHPGVALAGTYVIEVQPEEPCPLDNGMFPSECEPVTTVAVTVAESRSPTRPTVQITGAMVYEVFGGFKVQLDGAVTDPNNNVSSVEWAYATSLDRIATPSVLRTHQPNGINPYATQLTQAFDAGVKYIVLRARDADGHLVQDVARVEVPLAPANRPPVADFEWSAAVTGTTVRFASMSTDPDGDQLKCMFVFEKGHPTNGGAFTSTSCSPSALFLEAGPVRVALTVTDVYGKTASVTKTVEVITTTTPPPVVGSTVAPVARFTVAPTLPQAGQAISFDGSSSTPSTGATITSYAWAFSDGTTATGMRPQKAFASAGTRTATLTITDSKGATHSTTKSVQVSVAIARIVVTSTLSALSNCGNTGSKPQVTFTAKAYDAANNLVDVPITWAYETTAQGLYLSPSYTSRNQWIATVSATPGGGTMTVRAAPSPSGPSISTFGLPANYQGAQGSVTVGVIGCTPGA